MKNKYHPLLIIALTLLISSIPFTQAQGSTLLSYINRLDEQGLKRVVVEFEDEIDTSLIEEYGGRVIRTFKTFKGVVCEFPISSIPSIRQGDGVKEVASDMLIEMQSEKRGRRDPEELEPGFYTTDIDLKFRFRGKEIMRWLRIRHPQASLWASPGYEYSSSSRPRR